MNAAYQKLVEEFAEKCTCTPLHDRPCAGLLAGGLCDDLQLGRSEFDDDQDRDDSDQDEDY